MFHHVVGIEISSPSSYEKVNGSIRFAQTSGTRRENVWRRRFTPSGNIVNLTTAKVNLDRVNRLSSSTVTTHPLIRIGNRKTSVITSLQPERCHGTHSPQVCASAARKTRPSQSRTGSTDGICVTSISCDGQSNVRPADRQISGKRASITEAKDGAAEKLRQRELHARKERHNQPPLRSPRATAHATGRVMKYRNE